MRVAIISDLHIGSGDEADRFGHDDHEFLRFLKFMEANFEKIILLGDIFETLTGRAYGKRMNELRRCFQAHPEVSKRLVGNRRKYIYLHGNHDMLAAEAFSSVSEHFMSVGGRTILFTHGHVFDRISHNARGLAEWFVWLGGHLLRSGRRKTFDFLRGLDDHFLGNRIDSKKCDFRSRAMNAARRMGIDVMVTGHSHAGGFADFGDGLFLNSGACIEGSFQYLAMDLAAMNYFYNSTW